MDTLRLTSRGEFAEKMHYILNPYGMTFAYSDVEERKEFSGRVLDWRTLTIDNLESVGEAVETVAGKARAKRFYTDIATYVAGTLPTMPQNAYDVARSQSESIQRSGASRIPTAERIIVDALTERGYFDRLPQVFVTLETIPLVAQEKRASSETDLYGERVQKGKIIDAANLATEETVRLRDEVKKNLHGQDEIRNLQRWLNRWEGRANHVAGAYFMARGILEGLPIEKVQKVLK